MIMALLIAGLVVAALVVIQAAVLVHRLRETNLTGLTVVNREWPPRHRY